MLAEDFVLAGLTGLARAATVETAGPDGVRRVGAAHDGTAQLAAYYLCLEHEVPADVQRLIGEAALRVQRDKAELWADPYPFGRESPQPDRVARVAEAVEGSIDARNVHGVIAGTAALKALHDQPRLALPSLVRDLLAVQREWSRPWTERFPRGGPLDLTTTEAPADLPPYENERDMVRRAFEELTVVYANVRPAGGGLLTYAGALLKGHLITVTHAICELEHMGYDRLARSAQDLQRRLLVRARTLPPERDRERLRLGPAPFASLVSAAYWSAPKQDRVHSIKMPWAALSLLRCLPAAERPRYERLACALAAQY